MLAKLLKYDLKYSLKKLSIFYGIVILFAIYARISAMIRGEDTKYISILTFVLYFMMIGIGSFIVCIQRFWRNLFKGEGYLTFTLPVKPKLILLSKILNYVCCLIVTSFMFVIICLIQGFDPTCFDGIQHTLNAGMFIKSFIVFFQSVLGLFFLICTAITARFLTNKNKLLLSIVTYFGINTITTILNSINSLLYYKQALYGETVYWLIMFIISLTIVIIEYFAMCWIFEKKLNLE